jgi:hypothetical protein
MRSDTVDAMNASTSPVPGRSRALGTPAGDRHPEPIVTQECGGILKAATISFGRSMDGRSLRAAD